MNVAAAKGRGGGGGGGGGEKRKGMGNGTDKMLIPSSSPAISRTHPFSLTCSST